MAEKTSVLVVDDLRSIRLTLGGILEDEGHHVVTVENGYEAIKATRESHFDVIFMDIKMPGINGVQTFREIKKIDPQSVVIMMTAYSVEDLVKEALQEGAYAIIYKPFDMEKIISIIDEAMSGPVILVVDDLVTDRETLKAGLEEKGYKVSTAADADEAINQVKERRYNIIFMDIRLPGMDGVRAFEEVKKIDPQVAVIMMTGYTEEELVKKATSEGAYACIYKPFDMEKILAMVEEISQRRGR